MEENLRGDVVGKISDDGKLLREDLVQRQLQKIRLQQAGRQRRIVLQEVLHRFSVDLDDLQRGAPPEKILRQDTHTGTDFQDPGGGRMRIDDGAGHRLVGQKVLAKGLFGTDGGHTGLK